ncbi:hypothetical protein AAMO2058_000405400 [Amorphochlora amoebiformis]
MVGSNGPLFARALRGTCSFPPERPSRTFRLWVGNWREGVCLAAVAMLITVVVVACVRKEDSLGSKLGRVRASTRVNVRMGSRYYSSRDWRATSSKQNVDSEEKSPEKTKPSFDLRNIQVPQILEKQIEKQQKAFKAMDISKRDKKDSPMGDGEAIEDHEPNWRDGLATWGEGIQKSTSTFWNSTVFALGTFQHDASKWMEKAENILYSFSNFTQSLVDNAAIAAANDFAKNWGQNIANSAAITAVREFVVTWGPWGKAAIGGTFAAGGYLLWRSIGGRGPEPFLEEDSFLTLAEQVHPDKLIDWKERFIALKRHVEQLNWELATERRHAYQQDLLRIQAESDLLMVKARLEELRNLLTGLIKGSVSGDAYRSGLPSPVAGGLALGMGGEGAGGGLDIGGNYFGDAVGGGRAGGGAAQEGKEDEDEEADESDETFTGGFGQSGRPNYIPPNSNLSPNPMPPSPYIPTPFSSSNPQSMSPGSAQELKSNPSHGSSTSSSGGVAYVQSAKERDRRLMEEIEHHENALKMIDNLDQRPTELSLWRSNHP